MKNYGGNPSRVEMAADAFVGPTVTSGMAVTSAYYVNALFNAAIQENSTTTAAILVDMAKCADNVIRTGWIRGGVYVRIRTTQPCQIAQRFDTSAGITAGSGYSLAATDTIDLEFDEDYRYLEFIWTGTTGTLTHYIRQRPSHVVALADT